MPVEAFPQREAIERYLYVPDRDKVALENPKCRGVFVAENRALTYPRRLLLVAAEPNLPPVLEHAVKLV
jgi:hypothetical protein